MIFKLKMPFSIKDSQNYFLLFHATIYSFIFTFPLRRKRGINFSYKFTFGNLFLYFIYIPFCYWQFIFVAKTENSIKLYFFFFLEDFCLFCLYNKIMLYLNAVFIIVIQNYVNLTSKHK